MELKRIAIDTSKHVFTIHGIDARDQPVLRRNLKRDQVIGFLEKQPRVEVVMEACGGSHHWGRLLMKMGHRVRLIPPQYVKPFVKRGKNDRIDAEAICEAAGRPNMRFVAVKAAEAQAQAMVLSARDLLVRQRTQLINALRGHATAFGVVGAKGAGHATKLLARIAADAAIPAPAKEMLALLGGEIANLDDKIKELDRKMAAPRKASALSRNLAEVPGIGPVGAVTMALTVDPKQFESGRHFASWIGITPREKSTGGKRRMGGISRQGNERLRQLLVLGATSVIKVVKPGHRYATKWLMELLERRPPKVAAVALANKMARTVWAMMTSGEAYRPAPVAG